MKFLIVADFIVQRQYVLEADSLEEAKQKWEGAEDSAEDLWETDCREEFLEMREDLCRNLEEAR